MVTTITQQRKKQKIMLLSLGIVMFLIAAVLFWGFSNGGGAPQSLPQSSEMPSNIESGAAEDIMRDISIPRDFFSNKILQQFSPYEPIGAPEQSGRDNPFAPLQ